MKKDKLQQMEVSGNFERNKLDGKYFSKTERVSMNAFESLVILSMIVLILGSCSIEERTKYSEPGSLPYKTTQEPIFLLCH